MHRIVGLDWAQDSLRVATLQSGFRGFAIQDVRTVPLPAEGTPAERLKGAVDALGLSPPLGSDDTVAVAPDGALVATHLVTLPFSDPKRIEQVLPAEVEGAIPFDLSEVVWDYAVLGQVSGKTDVLVGIVKKEDLRKHLGALESAGIDPRQGGNASNFFGSTSDTFRITATGRVGRIEKKVTAVVRYDDLLGKMLYWKEE